MKPWAYLDSIKKEIFRFYKEEPVLEEHKEIEDSSHVDENPPSVPELQQDGAETQS